MQYGSRRQGRLSSKPNPTELHVRVRRRTRKVKLDVGQGRALFRPCLGIRLLDTAGDEFFSDCTTLESGRLCWWERGRGCRSGR